MYTVYLDAECYQCEAITGDGACFYWCVDAIRYFTEHQALRPGSPARLTNDDDRRRVHNLAAHMATLDPSSMVWGATPRDICNRERLKNFLDGTSRAVSFLGDQCYGVADMLTLEGLFPAKTTFSYWVWDSTLAKFKLTGVYWKGKYDEKPAFSLQRLLEIAADLRTATSGLTVMHKGIHFTLAMDGGLPLLLGEILHRLVFAMPSLYHGLLATAKRNTAACVKQGEGIVL